MGRGTLTEEQRAFVEAPAGRSIRLVAAAGSGKTHTVLERVRHLTERCGVAPDRILVLAFTRASRADLEAKAAAAGVRLRAATIDALAHRVIAEVGGAAGGRPDCSVGMLSRRLLALLSERPSEVAAALGPVSELYVDEAQDIDGVQYGIFRAMRDLLGCAVSFVGDPAQAIYGFRDGSARYFVEHEAEIDLRLTRSFRCPREILAFADAMQGASRSTSERSGPRPRVLHLPHAEAVREVVRLARKEGGRLAVVAPTRGNAEHSPLGLSVVANALYAEGIPFEADGAAGAGPDREATPAAGRAHGAVALRTIHASKGLEWPVVVLLDAHGDFLGGPYPTTSERFREQVNLLYVGATRAVEELHVVLAKRAAGPHPALRAAAGFCDLVGRWPREPGAGKEPQPSPPPKGPVTVRELLSLAGRTGRERLRSHFAYSLRRDATYEGTDAPWADLYAACAAGVPSKLAHVRAVLRRMTSRHFVRCPSERVSALIRAARPRSWSALERAARRRGYYAPGAAAYDAVVRLLDPSVPPDEQEPVVDEGLPLLQRSLPFAREVLARVSASGTGAGGESATPPPPPTTLRELRAACVLAEAYRSHAYYRMPSSWEDLAPLGAALPPEILEEIPDEEEGAAPVAGNPFDRRANRKDVHASFDHVDGRRLARFGDCDELELLIAAYVVSGGAGAGRASILDARAGSAREYEWTVASPDALDAEIERCRRAEAAE